MFRSTMTTCVLSCLAASFVTRGVVPVSSFMVRQQQQQPSLRRLVSLSDLYARSQRSSSSLSASATTSSENIPITLLSGFLGSGKTTTLQHLLENRDGLKIGVIVNDMASVNIDAKLVKNSDSSSGSDNAVTQNKDGSVVELQNGCACCSLADELLTTVDTLLEKRSFDAIVVELSGVADPIAIQQNWKTAKLTGHPVTRKADMKRVVTLIDSSTFGTDFMTWDVAGDRSGWVDPNDDCATMRKVPELLVDQIESADVLLLNKIDLAGPKQVKVATTLARSINDKADIEEVEFGKVTSPRQIIRETVAEIAAKETKSSSSNCCSNPDCSSHSHSHDHASSSSSSSSKSGVSTDRLGITSFIYKADRPFETRNLMGLLNTWPVPIKDDLEGLEHFSPTTNDSEDIGRDSPFFGVLRSKGFCWLAPTSWDQNGDAWRHDTAMYWSHAGKHFGITTAGKWWATLDSSKMKEFFRDDAKEFERIRAEDFVSEQWGDRRQEIVFIGVNINQEEITKVLDDCLLGEVGMRRYSEQLTNYLNTMMNAPSNKPSGLFDVGNYDNMDV